MPKNYFSLSRIILIALVTFPGVVSSLATPADEIKTAIVAGGAADIGHAPRAIFLRAFIAVAVRAERRNLPDYVAAAIRMRPDLTKKIVQAAMKVVPRQDPNLNSALVSRLIIVAIAANPTAAVAIAEAAIQARPELISCIIAGAIAAAPEERSQIAALETNFSLGLIFLITGRSEADPWNGSSTLNPANASDFQEENQVISPEQPPGN